MIDLQHQYNNYTTITHMRVSFTYWGPPLCEGLLYSCCIVVVQESNLIFVTTVQEISVVQIVHSKLRLTSKTTVLLSSPLFKKARILFFFFLSCGPLINSKMAKSSSFISLTELSLQYHIWTCCYAYEKIIPHFTLTNFISL
jgi:hypothetical protein